jgi:hypothetical protein
MASRRRATQPDEKVRRDLYVQLRNWDFAKRQPGGASLFIDTWLDGQRRKDARLGVRMQLRDALRKIAELEGENARLRSGGNV